MREKARAEKKEAQGMAENGPVAAAFAAPGRYIQGRGAIRRIGEVLE